MLPMLQYKSQILRINPIALLNCRFSLIRKIITHFFTLHFFFFSFEFNVGVFALKTTHCVRMCHKDSRLTWRTWARTLAPLVKIYPAPPYAESCKKLVLAGQGHGIDTTICWVSIALWKKKRVVQSWQHKLFKTFLFFIFLMSSKETNYYPLAKLSLKFEPMRAHKNK